MVDVFLGLFLGLGAGCDMAEVHGVRFRVMVRVGCDMAEVLGVRFRVMVRVGCDMAELTSLTLSFQGFERSLNEREPSLELSRRHYQQLSSSQRTTEVEQKMTKMVEKWEQIWSLSKLYDERLAFPLINYH